MYKYQEKLAKLSNEIWDYAELKFAETRSAKAMVEFLREEGFEVETGLGEIETAYSASFGSGYPVIGILGEFDALSGLSQQADLPEQKEREGVTCGHGCGHNLLGVAGIGAAMEIRDYLKETRKSGTVVFFGCPGEEGGSGKAYMARAGAFDKLDIILSWHPGGANAVMTGSFQANCQVYFRFKGTSSHAASAPHLGRSALDAVELMNVGVNYMREHMETTDRIHYAVLDTGGTSPNVVQGKAEVLYLIRSTDSEKVKGLYNRVVKIAQGAALMTETEVEIVFDKACSNVVSNSVLENLLYDSMVKVGVPEYTKEERAYAQMFRDTMDPSVFKGELAVSCLPGLTKKRAIKKIEENPIADFIIEHQHQDVDLPGSSDVGDASHVAPCAQFVGACYAAGTPAHSWQMVAQGKSSMAVKGMVFAADVLADAAIKVLDDPEIAKKAKEEFDLVTEGKKYECPIPPEVKPAASRG